MQALQSHLWLPHRKVLGRNLRLERQRLSLSQLELAEIAGLRRVTLYQFERGDRRPELDQMARLARAGVSIGFLLKGVRPVDNPTVDREFDAELRQLIADRCQSSLFNRKWDDGLRNTLHSELLLMFSDDDWQADRTQAPSEREPIWPVSNQASTNTSFLDDQVPGFWISLGVLFIGCAAAIAAISTFDDLQPAVPYVAILGFLALLFGGILPKIRK